MQQDAVWKELCRVRRQMTQQEWRTIAGQYRAGDVVGALKGSVRVLERKKAVGAR